MHALQRAYTSELYGFILIKLLKRKPRRRHRVAHPTTHHAEPCEIGGVVEILRSENVRDDEVVGKVGDRGLWVGKARGSCDGRHITARGSHVGVRCVVCHVKGVACASLCASFSRLPSFWRYSEVTATTLYDTDHTQRLGSRKLGLSGIEPPISELADAMNG